jgi:hypothetical protein
VVEREIDEELAPETKLGVAAGTEFALRAIAYHLERPNSRKDMLWEIENWTEELLLEDRVQLLPSEHAALSLMIVGLTMADRRAFIKKNGNVAALQELAFDLLDEIHAAKDNRVRRPRDIRGTPEWKAHRSWMKAYQRKRKAAHGE